MSFYDDLERARTDQRLAQEAAASAAYPHSQPIPWSASARGQIGDTTMQAGRQVQLNEMTPLNPETVALQNAMLRAYMSGSGEFGFGGAAKQANATMERAGAMRGIDPRSGVSQSLMARMLSEALAADAMNRQQYGMNLMQSSPAYYNSMMMQLGKKPAEGGFGQFAGNILGTAAGALGGGYLSALGNKWGS